MHYDDVFEAIAALELWQQQGDFRSWFIGRNSDGMTIGISDGRFRREDTAKHHPRLLKVVRELIAGAGAGGPAVMALLCACGIDTICAECRRSNELAGARDDAYRALFRMAERTPEPKPGDLYSTTTISLKTEP
jgi:hypothetical protein